MFAMIALFDRVTEQRIKNVWQQLKDHSISSYAFEVEDRRPHLTIASYNNLNLTEFIRQMNESYNDMHPLEITFNTIGSFLNSGTLFLSPTVTRELIEFHSNHHKCFHSFHDNPDSLYMPGKWVPHCTIANRLSKEKLSEAFRFCIEREGTFVGQISEVALIDVSEKNKAPIIYSAHLL